MAGNANSTTITRFKVDVVVTTTAPRQACTRPSRITCHQPKWPSAMGATGVEALSLMLRWQPHAAQTR